jgi:predicted phosphodiesterase
VIVVLSDIHFGLPGAPAPGSLLPAIAGASEVILNGDAAETASAGLQGRAEAHLAEFREAAQRAGAAVLRLEGNHDPGTGDPIAMRAGGTVAVTHGHAFHPAIAPWSPAADAVAEAFLAAHAAGHAHGEPWRTLLAARAAAVREREHERARSPARVLASMARRPWTFPMVIGYWRIFPELSARFAELVRAGAAARGEPEVRVVASGHSHRAGAWLVRGTLVLNTGSFTFPGQPHAVTVDGGEVALVPLVRRRGEWRQDAAGRRAWRIDEIARSTAARSTPVS